MNLVQHALHCCEGVLAYCRAWNEQSTLTCQSRQLNSVKLLESSGLEPQVTLHLCDLQVFRTCPRSSLHFNINWIFCSHYVHQGLWVYYGDAQSTDILHSTVYRLTCAAPPYSQDCQLCTPSNWLIKSLKLTGWLTKSCSKLVPLRRICNIWYFTQRLFSSTLLWDGILLIRLERLK